MWVRAPRCRVSGSGARPHECATPVLTCACADARASADATVAPVTTADDPSTPAMDALLVPPSIATRVFCGFTAIVEATKFQVYEVFLIFCHAASAGAEGQPR